MAGGVPFRARADPCSRHLASRTGHERGRPAPRSPRPQLRRLGARSRGPLPMSAQSCRRGAAPFVERWVRRCRKSFERHRLQHPGPLADTRLWHEDGANPSELARRVGTGPPTTTPVVARMAGGNLRTVSQGGKQCRPTSPRLLDTADRPNQQHHTRQGARPSPSRQRAKVSRPGGRIRPQQRSSSRHNASTRPDPSGSKVTACPVARASGTQPAM